MALVYLLVPGVEIWRLLRDPSWLFGGLLLVIALLAGPRDP